MRAPLALSALVALAAGCGGAVTAEQCAEFVEAGKAEVRAELAAQGGTTVVGFEEELLLPLVEDIRAGVRPWDEQGFGICRGKRTCDEFLGTDVGELPPGEYIMKAEMRVPNVGEPGTWKIRYDTQCVTTRVTPTGETTSTSDSSREYDVRFAGSERGYRLMPLRTIESPSNGGRRECTWTITAPHPDGDKVYTGSWSVPAAPE